MKRIPLVVTLLAVILLAASLTYWAMELSKPPLRAQMAALPGAMPEPPIDAAASLFGGRSAVVVSNYQLTGVVAAVPARDGVAIIAADGKPPQAYKVGHQVAPGVTVKEVQPRFVILLEGGVANRIDLPADAKDSTSLSQGANGANPGQGGMAPPLEPPPPPSQPVNMPPPPPTVNVPPTIVSPPTQ